MIKSTLNAYAHTNRHQRSYTHADFNMALHKYRVENALLTVMYAKTIDILGVYSGWEQVAVGLERIVTKQMKERDVF